LVNPVRIDPKGVMGPTRSQTQRRGWRRSSHGLYVPSWVDPSVVEQRIVEAAAVCPPYGSITGWAALRWLGGRWFEGTRREGSPLPVTIATTDARPQAGIAISAERLNVNEVIAHERLIITRALRSTLFEMRYADSAWAAVVVADMAAFSDLVSLDELWPYALAHGGMTGIPQARDAVQLADENTWSPMETVMRLIWTITAGLARPLTNQPIFDLQGRHVGTPDLLDVESGVFGEYDSQLHLDGKRRLKDLVREDSFRRLGLEPVVMIAGQSRDEVAARIVATRERAMSHPRPRLWTTQQPSWWIPTETVAQRRALSTADRARLLAHRAACPPGISGLSAPKITFHAPEAVIFVPDYPETALTAPGGRDG
jgi:hypothetical protein